MKKENKKTSHKNLEVLEFYKKLPFNFYSDSKIAIKNIKNFNLFEYYPFLEKTEFKFSIYSGRSFHL